MATLSNRELQDIIERDAPGSRLVDARPASAATDTDTDVGTPDLERLRGKDGGAARDVAHADSDDSDDVQIVTIAPKEAADPWDRGSAPKSVVISTKTKRIIGRQG
jgi:hypothetical protein